jgi:hypothetical protein
MKYEEGAAERCRGFGVPRFSFFFPQEWGTKGADTATMERGPPGERATRRMARNDRSRGVERGIAPLRFFSFPLSQRGIKGDWPGDEAEVSTAHASNWPSVWRL